MGLIENYGVFWKTDEVDWKPGGGHHFVLLGKDGERWCDFRKQDGLYVLYNQVGPYYVGRTKRLGERLRDHLTDHHADSWQRFSWFGFKRVLKATDGWGIQRLSKLSQSPTGTPREAIKDMEALLYQVVKPTANWQPSYPRGATRWTQTTRTERTDHFPWTVP